ncbi:hypothetical protein C7E25_24895, partial [Stenotrophomonas maltophilia]
MTDEERAEQQRRLADHLRGVDVVICTACGSGATGGYARALTDEERAEQQRRLADHLRGVDVVICTA